MDWIQGMQNAIDYIEKHIRENIDYEKVAKEAFSSSYHFQRVFGILFGITVGEYIRRRRLTLAGIELLADNGKITDIALKYGYDTPESFTRAFTRFHGIKPSQAKKQRSLNSFSRLSLKIDLIGGDEMKCKIKEMAELVLVGFKKHFTGVPYGIERTRQEEDFLTTTRAKQWLLIGASCDYTIDYCIITNVDDNGCDFYLAYKLDEWTRKELLNPKTTGVDFMDKMGFETIVIPKTLYAIFETERKKRPMDDYIDVRKKIITDWLPSSDYLLAKAPEVVKMHWRPRGELEKERYIEICLPVESRPTDVAR